MTVCILSLYLAARTQSVQANPAILTQAVAVVSPVAELHPLILQQSCHHQ